jgi:phosphohistidine phosphatase SixA
MVSPEEVSMNARARWMSCIILALSAGPAASQGDSIAKANLVKVLRQGGYVLVMRHANSPRETPDAKTADPENVNHERQLDDEGRTTATAMGKALRDLRIPIGEVYTSPTYRAMQTVRLAQLPNAKPVPELGDNGRSMQGGTAAQATWLQKQVTQFPTGTNTILITHQPNIAGAFPQYAAGLAEGESLIFGSDGRGGAALVGRVKIDEWPHLQP